jgi:hypothetical protein
MRRTTSQTNLSESRWLLPFLCLAIRNRARREIRVYQKLLKMVPSLHQRLLDSSDEEVLAVAAMVRSPLLLGTDDLWTGTDTEGC